jgi:hypothetical protein
MKTLTEKSRQPIVVEIRSAAKDVKKNFQGCLTVMEIFVPRILIVKATSLANLCRRLGKRCVAPLGERLAVWLPTCVDDSDCESGVFAGGGYTCRDLSSLKGKNDTNLIVKANPDRICSDWLSCKTSTSVWDPRTNSMRELCVEYGRCLEYSTTSSGSVCTRFAPSPASLPLTGNSYSKRDITFRGKDFSGFSLPGRYPVSAMQLTSAGGLNTGPAADATSPSCRAYPEADSPFPANVATFDASGKIITYDQ